LKDAFTKFDLTGRTAVITGGGTGLGYCMARGLARSGARVLIAARREPVLRDAAEALKAESGGDVIWHGLDLADRASIERFTRHVIDDLGGTDIYVGNAAISCFEHIETITDAAMDAMNQVNISANVAMARAFLPGMRRKRWGRFIFSSSAVSLATSPFEGMCMYATVKGAINAMARAIATEAGHDGVTANAIVHGFYNSDMVKECAEGLERQSKGAGKEFYDSFATMTAKGRAGEFGEIEGVVQFLASDAASYVTGASMTVDGGLSIMLRPNPVPEEPVFPAFLA
jgi:NAD(P)-dependent dehydrogenase (short-subunit alcohol dehydrogenase family)